MNALDRPTQNASQTRSSSGLASDRPARLPRLTGVAIVLLMIACPWQSSVLAQEQSSLPSAVSLWQSSESQAPQSGMAIWSYLLALNADSPVRHARTLFIPSDNTFRHLSSEAAAILLNPGSTKQREALLERSASADTVSISEIARQPVQLKTMDGRLLTIDATGTEIHVGDAEAIAVQKLDDGRIIFVLDDIMVDSLPDK